jgi:hypothetical protein
MIDRIATQLQLILLGHEPSSAPANGERSLTDRQLGAHPERSGPGWLTCNADSRVSAHGRRLERGNVGPTSRSITRGRPYSPGHGRRSRPHVTAARGGAALAVIEEHSVAY